MIAVQQTIDKTRLMPNLSFLSLPNGLVYFFYIWHRIQTDLVAFFMPNSVCLWIINASGKLCKKLFLAEWPCLTSVAIMITLYRTLLALRFFSTMKVNSKTGVPCRKAVQNLPLRDSNPRPLWYIILALIRSTFASITPIYAYFCLLLLTENWSRC